MRSSNPPEAGLSVRPDLCVPRDNSRAPIPISRTQGDAVTIRSKKMAQQLALAAGPVIEAALRGGDGDLSSLPRTVVLSRRGYRDEQITISFVVGRR